ncbi:hypothetical protein BCR42DRAFT_3118 [Absidia repens]|uniref:Uncharacterized protein n=1 Tax=Absidia repens TaxID=90262 RepID=A0A1X2J046_9FUNG|nr:hypothetical protein BCR42DRAFT_3118 [Absidia repens]
MNSEKSNSDHEIMQPWVSSVSPFGVTTFEPIPSSHALTPTRPSFPKHSSSSNKLQRFFGFGRRTQPQQQQQQQQHARKTPTIADRPVYSILKAAKSVPLLRESQRKMRDEHSRASVHPQLDYCDDNAIVYPLEPLSSPSPVMQSLSSSLSPTPSSSVTPQPNPSADDTTNAIYRKKQRQAPSSLTPTPPAAWKIASSSLNKADQRQKRRTKSLQTDKDCIIS